MEREIRIVSDAAAGQPFDPALLRAPGEAAVTVCDLPFCRYRGQEVLVLACPCGCGEIYEAHYASNAEPQGVHAWQLIREPDGTITLRKHPDNRGGGSGSLWGPCGAHYFIEHDRVIPESGTEHGHALRRR